MSKDVLKITDLECCPFCTGTQVYTKDWVEGSTITTYDFNFRADDTPLDKNCLQQYKGSRVYCSNCHKCLGTFNENILSSAAAKQLEKIAKVYK